MHVQLILVVRWAREAGYNIPRVEGTWMSISEQNGNTDASGIRVVLGCCMLKPRQNFIDALLPIIRENIFEGYVFPQVSLLPHARNIICALAYEKHPDFTHLLMIDDDMTFTLSDILKLYKADKPVVSGIAVMRKPPYRIVASLDPQKCPEYIKEESVVNVVHVGMAFTLIKREVLDITRQDHDVWFTMDREPRLTFNDEWEEKKQNCSLQEAMEFGQDSHLNSKLPGEDIAFSHLCEKLNIPMYVHCGVLVGHVGEKTYDITDTANEPTPAVIVP